MTVRSTILERSLAHTAKARALFTLLECGPLTTTQLMVALRADEGTLRVYCCDMLRAGIVSLARKGLNGVWSLLPRREDEVRTATAGRFKMVPVTRRGEIVAWRCEDVVPEAKGAGS